MCVCKGEYPKKGYYHGEWYCESKPKRQKKGIDYCGKAKSPKGVCLLPVNHEGSHKDFVTIVAFKVFDVSEDYE